MTRPRLVGIRPWKGGWQAYVQIHGKTYSKSFPKTKPLAELRTWREDQQKKYAALAPPEGSFAADIDTYLKRVQAMRSVDQFASYLRTWATLLGRDRPRSSIAVDEIDAVLQQWLIDGAAPATVIKRRTALLSLFHTLDGKQAPNPVRASRPPRVPKAEVRSLDYPTIDRIVAVMPESLTKRRVLVLAHTGLPPGMLQAVTPADLDLTGGTVRVQPRRKGQGVEARTIPLTRQGIVAFRAFARAQAFGVFAGAAANRVFQRACRKVDVKGATLYDLRHSFGAALYRATRDLATVARFMLHASPAMSERYAQAAMQDVDEAAARALGRNLSPKPVPVKKRKRHKHLRRVS